MEGIYEGSIKLLKSDRSILPDDKRLIVAYAKERKAIANLCERRMQKVINTMKNLSRMKRKSWNKFRCRNDIIKLVENINTSKYAEDTKSDHKKEFKRFYKWLVKNPHPVEIEDIRTAVRVANRKLPEEMFTEDDILRMVDSSKTVRDKALVMTLWSLGCRPHELLGMQVCDIQFDEYGCKIYLSGKTGSRTCRSVEAAPYLKVWLGQHPNRKDIHSAVWIYSDGKKMEHGGLKAMLERLQEKIRMQKPMNPYQFRHSRATFLLKIWPEAVVKKYLGWGADSDMPGTYGHLSDRDTDDAMLKMHNLGKDAAAEKSKLTPQVCPRCRQENGAEEDLCSICQYPLRVDVAVAYDEKMKIWLDLYADLIQDPRVKTVLEEQIRKKQPQIVKVEKQG
ncbi:MAG: tyrosine-type recombinase/integrase [Candidatus Micrarchaeota archaeon]|nr:tyrosine-type recombinase/integrase [Candidatus Micrarchaeota archaeon]